MKNFKVLIKRSVPSGKDIELLTLVSRLRARASHHAGFVSAEILWNAEHPEKYVTLSQWLTPEDWNHYAESKDFIKLQKEIDALGCVTEIEKYHYPVYWENIPRDAFPAL